MTRVLILLLAALPSRADDAPALWEKGAKLQKLSADGSGGEGPAWHPELGVLTSGRGGIHRFHEGKSSIHRKDAGTNGLLFDKEGRLLACEPVQRRVTRTDAKGRIEVLAEKLGGKRFNQPNDLTVDAKGRVFFSDPVYGPRGHMELKDEKGRPVEGVYRIDAPGKVVRVLGRDDVDRPNGVLVSGNGKWLYVADNNNDEGGTRKLWR
ncbi:MAG: SMP-30/gluconolactonase/LRE family protein, partial [Gemmataceae bacterium]|nr:SMP-30/gluconolactonase/LRE family protein [Gemmataceae bacterium]